MGIEYFEGLARLLDIATNHQREEDTVRDNGPRDLREILDDYGCGAPDEDDDSVAAPLVQTKADIDPSAESHQGGAER
jgi:hypothetical protein